jgi:hypothetical protein
MSARVAAVLVVLLVALGGGALLIREQADSRKPAAASVLGQPLLKGLKAAEIAAISIRSPAGAITLARKEQGWTIAERDGFAADMEKVREFVLKAIELKIGQTEPIGEKDRARLGLDASGTAVEFRGADGKPLARLLAGRKYFKTEPDNPEKAAADGRFVLLPEDAKSVVIVSDPLAQATPESADWVAKAGIAAEKVKTLEVRFAGGEGWKIERATDNADWRLAGPNPGEKLDIGRANSAAYSLSSLDLADVAAKDAKDTGLDKPTTVTATTFDGLTYSVKIGRLEAENYYAAVQVAGEPKPEGKDAEERLKKIGERLSRERALAGHTLLVPKSRLEDLLKKRSELLEKKEAKKP